MSVIVSQIEASQAQLKPFLPGKACTGRVFHILTNKDSQAEMIFCSLIGTSPVHPCVFWERLWKQTDIGGSGSKQESDSKTVPLLVGFGEQPLGNPPAHLIKKKDPILKKGRSGQRGSVCLGWFLLGDSPPN